MAVKRARRCAENGFDNLKRAPRIDQLSLDYTFCPGKATWSDEIQELFVACRASLESGILPGEGPLQNQSAVFVEVWPHFVIRWRERFYGKVWQDVRSFAEGMLTGLFGKKGRGT